MVEKDPKDYRDLLIKIVNRDEAAYRLLFYQFYKNLVQYGYAITRDKGNAEDIVSDLFLKIWTMEHRLLHIQSLPFYLYRAVRNNAISLQKGNARLTYGEIDTEETETQTPEKILISKENVDHIQHAVDSLPSRCRQVFTLIRDNGLSYQETADILEISIHTVNRHMQEALHKLYSMLKK